MTDERIATESELCARCGQEMMVGTFVVDVETIPEEMPHATAEWATVHRMCPAKETLDGFPLRVSEWTVEELEAQLKKMREMVRELGRTPYLRYENAFTLKKIRRTVTRLSECVKTRKADEVKTKRSVR